MNVCGDMNNLAGLLTVGILAFSLTGSAAWCFWSLYKVTKKLEKVREHRHPDKPA